MNPAEALRLSRARTLLEKHSAPFDSVTFLVTAEGAAAMIDEANAAKDATIAALRKQMREEQLEFQREARDIAADARWQGREEGRFDGRNDGVF